MSGETVIYLWVSDSFALAFKITCKLHRVTEVVNSAAMVDLRYVTCSDNVESEGFLADRKGLELSS